MDVKMVFVCHIILLLVFQKSRHAGVLLPSLLTYFPIKETLTFVINFGTLKYFIN